MADEDDIVAVEIDTSAETGDRRGWPRRIAKWTISGIVGALAIMVIGLLLLDTGPGRRVVAEQLRGMEFANGMRIEVGRIEGSLYGTMVLHDLSVHDPKGEFLYSPEVAVAWHPLRYAASHVDIDSLVAQRVYLRRVPRFRETSSEGPLLPDLDIDIDSLEIGRFVAEAAVAGQERVATIAGRAHIADGRAQVRLDGRTMAGAGNAGGDTIALDLDAVPDANRLKLDLTVDAPAGGVIASLAGLTEPLHATVNGSGEWEAWNGTLVAALAGSRVAKLSLAARNGKFSAMGTASLARIFKGPAARLLGPSTTIDLTAALDRRRADMSGSLSSDSARLNVNGLVDLSNNNFEALKLGFVLLRPSALAENLSGSGLHAILTLDGPFATPQVEYTLKAERLAMDAVGIDRLAARGNARIDAGRIVIPVAASAARITGLDSVAGGSLANVILAGDIAVEGSRVLSDNMRIRSDRIDATAILAADTARGFYSGVIDGRIDNYRIETVGIFDVTTGFDVRSERNGFALAGKVRAKSSRIDNPSVRDFLGGNAVGSADVRYGSDGVIRFAGFRLEAPAVRVTGGQGSWIPGGRIDLVADAITREYGPVGVRLAGTLDNPDARITARSPGFGVGLANVDARLVGLKGGYRVNLKGDTDYGPLVADITLGSDAQASLAINSASLSGIGFTGSLRRTSGGPYAGQLRASGNGLEGLIRLDAQGRYQQALVNVRASGTVLPGTAGLKIGSGRADARIVLYDTPHIVADAQFADTRLYGYDFNAGRVIIDYRAGRGTAKALVEGTAGAPFRLAANAKLEPKLWTAMLTGRTRGIEFRTTGPARIVRGAGGYELLPTRVDFGKGNARLAGTYGERFRLQTRLERVDLDILNAFVPGYGLGGSATGSLDFAQATPNAFPNADARLTITGFTRTTADAISEAVDVNFVGKLLPDGGEASAVFRQKGTVIGRMNASLRPLPPGSGDWIARLLESPLGGGLRYNGPAETLFSLAGQRGQHLAGPIGVAADFSCRVADPCVNGIVRGSNLTYEHHLYGLRLTAMALEGRFGGNRLTIDRLDARAGNGTVAAKGFIGLAAEAGYPMDIAIDVQNARLARSEALSARATGDLRLTKAAGQAALLSGTLKLPETRYKVIREGAAQVPELTGVRFKPHRGAVRITGNEPASPGQAMFGTVRLDVDLVAPERLYVSGMGLESEWKARFKIGGTTVSPTMTGTVDLVRGTLGFAGRSFELTEGRVGFTGGPANDPTLRIVATEDVEDITVNVNVTGRATNPQVAFTSVPGLPQDEVVSRILFGQSIANLSTLQAVQLAASLNSLRGSGGGLNPLGKLRSATGVDRLRILGPDEASGRGTALAAGQYITNDIYVELITDARGFTATQLEVSVTPWLSVLSQAGGSGVSNLNVRIKKNY